MIKNVLIPEKIGSYYLFSKRILGFDIGKAHVSATQILIRGRSITIERNFFEQLESGAQATYQEKVSKAIATIVAQAKKNCVIYTSLSSAVTVFKTLKLPFFDREKISMVIGFEIEPLLPFPLADAVVDFIITKQHPDDHSAEIVVAAVQKNNLVQHLEFFSAAGIAPEKVSVDMFDLYALYKKMPPYANLAGGVALIDLGLNSTRIAYIHDGQLRMIRTLPKGTSRLIKQLGDMLGLQPQEALEKLMRFGLGQSDTSAYNDAIQEVMQNFWQEIQFTLTSFATKDTGQLVKLLLLGGGSAIKDLDAFVAKYMGISCEQFSLQHLANSGTVQAKAPNLLSAQHIQSIATALPSALTDEITLRQKEFALSDKRTFIQQIIVAGVLVIALLGTLITHYILQTRSLGAEIAQSQEEVMSELKKQFKIPKEETTFDDVVDWAKKAVKKEEQMWFAFSGQARSSFLKYLLALHALDKEGLGLDVERITVSDGALLLKAKVKDYDALKKLEKDLRQSKLFSYVEPQEKTDFTMRITLVKNGEE